MTRHIYLKSEILATKIRMAEICRVLLVTLLLCLYWLPSDTRGESGSPSVGSTEDPRPAQGIGGGGHRGSVNDGPDNYNCLKDISKYTNGQNHIITLLSSYIDFGCKDTFRGTLGYTSSYSSGERYLINLLLSYFHSNCEAQAVTPSPDERGNEQNPDSDFTPGEKYIIKLLTNYTSSGCKAAVQAIGTGGAMQYCVGESYIIKLLLFFFRSGCKVASTGKSGESVTTDDSGRHLQSVVLELFLLIFGVCLTRIEL